MPVVEPNTSSKMGFGAIPQTASTGFLFQPSAPADKTKMAVEEIDETFQNIESNDTLITSQHYESDDDLGKSRPMIDFRTFEGRPINEGTPEVFDYPMVSNIELKRQTILDSRGSVHQQLIPIPPTEETESFNKDEQLVKMCDKSATNAGTTHIAVQGLTPKSPDKSGHNTGLSMGQIPPDYSIGHIGGIF